jgi:type II secretory pathway predicted ATPase ExeA
LHETQDGFAKLLGIILFAQPEIVPTVRGWDNREVSARLDMFELPHIESQRKEYIEFKLGRAGQTTNALFESEAIETMFSFLAINHPLEINVIAAKALNMAYDQGHKRVTAEVAELSYKELANHARKSARK